MATNFETLSLAVQHHQAGRLQAAEQVYRQILAVEPNHVDAIHLLGVIASQVGKYEIAVEYIGRAIQLHGSAAPFHNNLGEAYRGLRRISEAIACYRRALELKPDYAEAQNNLAIALADDGKPDEALACYRRALELKPGYAEAHYNIGNLMRSLSKLDEAVASYRQALALKPGYAEAHCNLGVALKEQGKPDEALACCHRALALKPDFAEVYNNQGAALKDQGKLNEAVAAYRRALELRPDYAEAHCNLGNVLKDQGKLEEAAACCRQAIALKVDLAEAHNNLGSALAEQGEIEEAVAAYRRALALKPGYAEAHGNLGAVLEEIGDLQGAEDSFRAAVRCNPRLGFAHGALASLLRGKFADEDLAAQRRLLEEANMADRERLFLHFGLAQVLDARGEYAEAAEHLARGNALQLSEWRKCGRAYDPQEYEARVSRMMAVCGPDFFARVRGFGLEDLPGSETPVFIVGLPRSGTTLIEQILAGHSQVFAAGELKLVRGTLTALGGSVADSIEGLNRLDRETAGRLASRHLERLRALHFTALRIVDKMPENYFYLGALAGLLPRAKFIHCRRDLRDVAVSCWMTHFRDVRWANDQQHIASRFHEYQRMMEHWRKVLPVPLLEVDYEETVANVENVARKLIAWCGLEWEPKCLEFHQAKRAVRTASAVQVRQPIFRTSVGRWKHYEQSLATLLSAILGGR